MRNLSTTRNASAFLSLDPGASARPEKRSMVYSFTFPPQDFKMRIGDDVLRAGSLEPAGEIVRLEEDARRISLKLGPKCVTARRRRVPDPKGAAW